MESASSLCKLPGITECVKILRIGFGLPDNYYVHKLINLFFDRLFKAFYEIVCLFVPFMFQLLRHSSFIGYFWQLIFWKKKKTHPFERLQESETRRNYILKIGFGFGVSSLEKLLIVGSLRFQQLC